MVKVLNQYMVSTEDGVPMVSTIILSENMDLMHDSILVTIEKHKDMFLELGDGEIKEQDFKIALNISNNKSLLKKRYAFYLNESQVNFLFSLSRNTENIVKFKFSLTKTFDELKRQVSKPMSNSEMILLQAQEVVKLEKQVNIIEDDVNYLKNKSPIVYNQIKILEDKRKSKTKQLVGYDPTNEKSKENYSKTIRELTKKFKNKFGVARYADLPKDSYESALKWLNDVELVDLVG